MYFISELYILYAGNATPKIQKIADLYMFFILWAVFVPLFGHFFMKHTEKDE